MAGPSGGGPMCLRVATAWVIVLTALVTVPAEAATTRWTPDGLPGGAVNGVAVDPVNPSTVYAGTGGGAYRSLDAGASWRLRSSGLTTSELTTMAVAPSDNLTVYAGTTWAGVARSTDGGANWTASGSGLNNYQIYA